MAAVLGATLRPVTSASLRGCVLLLGLVCLVLAGCAGRRAQAPRYKSLDELGTCAEGECVEAELRFRHWADAEHYRGRMPYHCDPGSELDGPPDPAVTRLIFVLHGVIGPSQTSLARMVTPPGLDQLRNVNKALRRAQSLDPSIDPDSIAIIAPSFQRTDQWQPWTDEDKRAWTWERSTWNQGTLAEPRETRTGIVRAEPVSSFDVFDEFLRAALVKFPSLEQIVVVGHSTGGQAVHRYVLLGVGVHELITAEGVEIRYVVANPGVYAFPLQRRKLPPGKDRVPAGAGQGDTLDWRWDVPRGCKGYDEWGYGMTKLWDSARGRRAAEFAIDSYLRPVDRKLARRAMRDPGSSTWAKAARQALLLQYASREVWHIQASGDLQSMFGDDCKATQQGRSRFERFSNFQEAWQRLLGIEAPSLHFVALDGLANQHNSKAIYTSDAGLHVLFR